MDPKRILLLLAMLPALVSAASAQTQHDASGELYPDVVAVQVHAATENVFDFDVTVSSPYDTAQRYADGFRIAGKDGKVYGETKLLHDHASEQPFTRGLHGVTIPPGVRVVVVQARDRKAGYGGKAVDVVLPGR